MSSETEIRPFQVDTPDEVIADLRRRVAATCWPGQELVADGSQGVQLATIQELARYWATDYDWRACEARLNALPTWCCRPCPATASRRHRRRSAGTPAASRAPGRS